MNAIKNEDFEKREKVKKMIESILEIKARKKEVEKNKRRKHLVIRAIRGTFLAAFLWSNLSDSLFSEELINWEEDLEADDDGFVSPEDVAIDEAFEEVFQVFEEFGAEDIQLIADEIDVSDLCISDLDSAQDELNLLLIQLA